MLWSPGPPLLPNDHIGLHLLLGQLPRVESGWGTAHSNSTPTPNCVPDDPALAVTSAGLLWRTACGAKGWLADDGDSDLDVDAHGSL